MNKCEKCGGRIKAGEEIKTGIVKKKYYHPKCHEQIIKNKIKKN